MHGSKAIRMGPPMQQRCPINMGMLCFYTLMDGGTAGASLLLPLGAGADAPLPGLGCLVSAQGQANASICLARQTSINLWA